MTRLSTLATLLLLSILPAPASLNHEAMLEAIKLREASPNGMVGKLGERGDYQLMPLNVRKYGGWGKREASAHLSHVIITLTKRGIDPNPFNLGLAWVSGEYNVGYKKLPMAAYHYAREVAGHYEKLTASSPPPPPP